MTQEETIAALQAIKSKRAHILKEAAKRGRKLGFHADGSNRRMLQDACYPECNAALLREISLGDAAIVRDPFNPDLLHTTFRSKLSPFVIWNDRSRPPRRQT